MAVTFRHDMPFGAQRTDAGVRFRLYAPAARRVDIVYGDAENATRAAPLAVQGGGWFEATLDDARAGTRYGYRLDGASTTVPDPASRFQPDGVHGSSLVVDPTSFAWPDAGWNGRPWHEHVFYELHVGTFTPQGSYGAASRKLDHLAELGITAIELMPLAEVPGARNWGYDGVLPYAPTRNYGSPDDLKAFIAASHARGVAVYLDVVYNHFGPEGNYLHGYAPAFYTDRYKTPWGAAIDVSPERLDVRAFFIENALYWTHEYRFDGLRLDAVHAIYDGAERLFLHELASAVRARSDRHVHLILENEANEAPLLERAFRAQWNDDEHHALHVLATSERDGYYADYAMRPLEQLGRTLTEGFAYQGQRSDHKGAARGTPSAHLPLDAFIVFAQNHDQVGNRPFGDRLTAIASPQALEAVASVYLLAPSVPLVFMGEEWGASSPFLFFCDFEPELARLVTQGRRNEFGSFAAFADPTKREAIPDPSAADTFERSRLRWDELEREPHARWLALYRRLLEIRAREIAPRIATVRGNDAAFSLAGDRGLHAQFRLDDATLALDANLSDATQSGFESPPRGLVLYCTHDPTYPGGEAPAWSVRWTLQ